MVNRSLSNLETRLDKYWRKSCKINGEFLIWWAREDSNLQPDRYERPALTIELRARTATTDAGGRISHTMLQLPGQLRPHDSPDVQPQTPARAAL
jgi:hypothetical protein